MHALHLDAFNGDAETQLFVGYQWGHNKSYGAISWAQAAAWYRMAAERGLAEAQYNVGLDYRDGKGVRRDHDVAAFWFCKAGRARLDQGRYEEAADCFKDTLGLKPTESAASLLLGCLHRWGAGVPQNYEEAAKLFRASAEQGFALTQLYLGEAYAKGEGVPQDYEQAAAWYRRAAEQGDEAAECRLANAYAEGKGVPQDPEQAAFWYRPAADEEMLWASSRSDTFTRSVTERQETISKPTSGIAKPSLRGRSPQKEVIWTR